MDQLMKLCKMKPPFILTLCVIMDNQLPNRWVVNIYTVVGLCAMKNLHSDVNVSEIVCEHIFQLDNFLFIRQTQLNKYVLDLLSRIVYSTPQ